jgi:hypothetical protein
MDVKSDACAGTARKAADKRAEHRTLTIPYIADIFLVFDM